MPPSAKGPKPQSVRLNVNYGAVIQFDRLVAFNAFTIETIPNGLLLSIGFVHQGLASEVVSFILGEEGLIQLRAASTAYVKEFGQIDPYSGPTLSYGRQGLPAFVNHIRPAIGGSTGEIGLFAIQLNDIANAAQGRTASEAQVNAVQVALLHSDRIIHQQLMLALMETKMIAPFQFVATSTVRSGPIAVSEAQTIEPGWDPQGRRLIPHSLPLTQVIR